MPQLLLSERLDACGVPVLQKSAASAGTALGRTLRYVPLRVRAVRVSFPQLVRLLTPVINEDYAMNQYLHMPFAVALLIAVGWTTIFSFTNKPGIRGFRNLGILASYVLVLVFLFVAGWRAALVTWAVFGVAGGVIYICWEILQRVRTAAGQEKPGVSFSPLVHGLFAWPIMVPEAIEYALAELGILRPPPPASPQTNAETGARPNDDSPSPT